MAGERILIIDDDQEQRQLFATVLTDAGYAVVQAAEGQAGVALYRQAPCDLIITDIFMPNEDGIETIFELKSRWPHVKIIAISGGGRWAQYGNVVGPDEPLDMATHFGADRTLKKPVKIQTFLESVAELLHIKISPQTPVSVRSPIPEQDARKKILIIEDDAAQRQLFKTALEQAGYLVTEAGDGQAGLACFREAPVDLIITDIFMPKEDGIETIFSLKAAAAHSKIIAISGGGKWAPYGNALGPDEPLEMAKRFGADRTLKKPVKIKQLLAYVDELLDVKGRLYAE
jgi:CheY-like chemotaxis protein